jgi:hypothetical protein
MPELREDRADGLGGLPVLLGGARHSGLAARARAYDRATDRLIALAARALHLVQDQKEVIDDGRHLQL